LTDSEARKGINLTLDCFGVYCPMPVLQTRQALGTLTAGQILEVLADDVAAEDIKALVECTGQKILTIEKTREGLRFLIQKIK
jgi:tRNA 2-thiouridine synthesizing protein A